MYQDNFQLIIDHLKKIFEILEKNQYDASKNSKTIWTQKSN